MMKNKIYAFLTRDETMVDLFRNSLMCRVFDQKEYPNEKMLSASDYILDSLGKFIADVRAEKERCKYPDAVVFEDFLARVDEAENVKPYFEELLSLGEPVMYIASCQSSLDRIKATDLPIEIYKSESQS